MANLREIKGRIDSVTSTMQVTRTMEMISTAKIRKALDRAKEAEPYKDAISRMLANVASAGFDASPENSGFLPVGEKTVLVRLDGKAEQIDLGADNGLPKDLELLILTVLKDYKYLL